MNIVIPMAGRGSRFSEAGFAAPKPLIDVRGRPMYSWAVDSLPLELASQVIFICLAEHLRDRSLEDDILSRYERFQPVILPLDEVTRGQACTVLKARILIDNNRPLLIYNADTYCRTGLAQFLPDLPDTVRGLLGVFEAPGTQWSFARVDATGRVMETAEKQRISNLATTGLYYFSAGEDFVRHADAMIAEEDTVRGEFYVAPIYNRLIAAGDEIRVDLAEEVWVLGTPEDLARFDREYPR